MNKKGFTLIEVLVSILILSVVLAGGIALYFNADKLMAEAVHKKLATEIANKEMEEIRQMDDISILAATTETIKIGDMDATKTIPAPILSADSNYWEVRVHLGWNEWGTNTPRETELITYIAND